MLTRQVCEYAADPGEEKIMEQVPQPPLNEHRESLENPHLFDRRYIDSNGCFFPLSFVSFRG